MEYSLTIDSLVFLSGTNVPNPKLVSGIAPKPVDTILHPAAPASINDKHDVSSNVLGYAKMLASETAFLTSSLDA